MSLLPAGYGQQRPAVRPGPVGDVLPAGDVNMQHQPPRLTMSDLVLFPKFWPVSCFDIFGQLGTNWDDLGRIGTIWEEFG